MIRALVCGGRKYHNFRFLSWGLDYVHTRLTIACVIHGKQTGADTLGGEWGRLRGIPVIEEEADWDKYGDMAGRIRNNRMLKTHRPELVIAFDGGTGTAHMRKIANRQKKPKVKVLDASGGRVQFIAEFARMFPERLAA